MTVSTMDAAKLICGLGNWQVTNLKLQKILYLAHMVYMGNHQGEPLVGDLFEAWDYGPVVPALYHAVKQYGNKPIRTGFYTANDITLESNEGSEIKAAADYLLPKSPSRLVDFTHRKGGAWEQNYVPGVLGVTIPNEDIMAEYKDIFGEK